MTSCPPEDVLVALLDGTLPENEAATLHKHMDTCTACLTVLASVAGTSRSGTMRALVPELASAITAVAASSRSIAKDGDHAAEGPNPPRSASFGSFGQALWEPPKAFDDFEIIRPIGHGGMGRVYLAHDSVLDRPVAIKFVAEASPDQKAVDRFLLEARAIARLQHPNVVAIFRIGQVEGRPYLAYEYVEGRSLDEIGKPMPWQGALAIALGLARGLAAAHKAGVLHRDLKPANAILMANGDVKLLDFGIAKLHDLSRRSERSPKALGAGVRVTDHLYNTLASAPTDYPGPPQAGDMTETHAILGTPLYLAPEIWSGGGATGKTDIYSFGLVIYELCAGRLPNAGLDLPTLARRTLAEDLPPIRSVAPLVPEVFAEVIDRSVRRSPQARYATADELREAIESADSICRAFQLVKSVPLVPTALEDDSSLVTASFARLSPAADALVFRFYSKLFEAAPSIRGLFPKDMAELRGKLASALTLAVENLRRPDVLVPMLETLGRRHAAYGAEPAHFDVVGKALLGAMGELDPEGFTPAVAAAWERTYNAIADAMRRGLRQGLPGATTTSSGSVSRPVLTPMPPTPNPSSPSPESFQTLGHEAAAAPETQYTRSGDVTIAYQIIGDGPIDIVLVQGWVTHLDLSWELPAINRFRRKIAAFSRLILYDMRGSGLSDRDSPGSLEERRDDLCAVLDAASVKRAAILGVGAGCAVAALLGATRPERASALIFYAGVARALEAPDYPCGAPSASVEETVHTIRSGWGSPLFLERDAPSLADDPAIRKWWASYLRTGASPGGAAALFRANAAIDVRDALPRIKAPTLVARRAGDRTVTKEASLDMASRIPGARLLEMKGDDHMPFAGDADALVEAIRSFLLENRSLIIDREGDFGDPGSSSRGVKPMTA